MTKDTEDTMNQSELKEITSSWREQRGKTCAAA